MQLAPWYVPLLSCLLLVAAPKAWSENSPEATTMIIGTTKLQAANGSADLLRSRGDVNGSRLPISVTISDPIEGQWAALAVTFH